MLQHSTNKPFRYALVTLATWALLGAGVASAASSSCIGDVVFLMDNTGSMGGIIRSTTAAAKRLVIRYGAMFKHNLEGRDPCLSIGW